jgi:hypothetical protein
MFRQMERTYGNTERQHLSSMSPCAIGVVCCNRHHTRGCIDCARAVVRIRSHWKRAQHGAQCYTEHCAKHCAHEISNRCTGEFNIRQRRGCRWTRKHSAIGACSCADR